MAALRDSLEAVLSCFPRKYWMMRCRRA